ncbi:hypothetical protein E2562_023113 [Oryza meyeriana var. granulata]|uniref:Peptidase S54 rhomboid domain-containing protein n=1 Tax=Oryza meyeriana var. granulata TaxID=110450 RepID=A0A6G1E1A5_9ORYZ|nr:hypothetical protein E2562_023113 [Oryza meyeriana var. granulata]
MDNGPDGAGAASQQNNSASAQKGLWKYIKKGDATSKVVGALDAIRQRDGVDARGANVVVFMLWRLLDLSFMRRHFMISLDNFKSGWLHTMLTSAFSHAESGHLITNMIGLYFFGSSTLGSLATEKTVTGWVTMDGSGHLSSDMEQQPLEEEGRQKNEDKDEQVTEDTSYKECRTGK